MGLRNCFLGCMAEHAKGFDAVRRRSLGRLCLQPCPTILAPDNGVVDSAGYQPSTTCFGMHVLLGLSDISCGYVCASAGCLPKPKHYSLGSRPGRTARHLSLVATSS